MSVCEMQTYFSITRGLSPPARYRLPTPRNRLRGSHSDRFANRARFARSLCYDSRDNITHKFEYWYLHNSLSSVFTNMKTVARKFLSCFSKL